MLVHFFNKRAAVRPSFFINDNVSKISKNLVESIFLKMAWSVGKPFFLENNKYNNLKFLLQHCKTKVGPQPFFKKIVSFFYNILIYKYRMSVKQVFSIGPYLPLINFFIRLVTFCFKFSKILYKILFKKSPSFKKDKSKSKCLAYVLFSTKYVPHYNTWWYYAKCKIDSCTL